MDLLAALGVAALLTRVGFALYVAGLVRAKNSAGAVLRTICDVCITVLAFWAVGAALFYAPGNGWLGIDHRLLFGWRVEQSGYAPILFFYFAMLLTASSVLSGALAERSRFFPLCIGSLALGAFVFPVAAHWVWHGWLARRGFLDIGGGAALHLPAAVFAAVAAGFVGPRSGKFNRDGSSAIIPGHNVPLASAGMLLIAIGWIAYLGGASALVYGQMSVGIAALNVLLGASAAGLASMLFGQFRYGKPDVILVLLGILGGLVSLCAPAAAIPSWAAVVVGLVAGVIVPLAAVSLDLRCRLDDPLGVIAVHGVGGAWGVLAAAFFIPHPLGQQSRLHQIAVQVVGLLCIAAFAAICALIVFGLLKKFVGVRAREADEFDGLDLAEHDIGAYPDFQQTTIKSYHLREM